MARPRTTAASDPAPPSRKLSPSEVRDWVRIFRDLAITFIAGFMLIYETVSGLTPNAYIVGAGLTLLGIPPALRFDELLRPRVPRPEQGEE